MEHTVVGLFDNLDIAQHVVNDLVNAGFSRNDVSLVANDTGNTYSRYLPAAGTTVPVRDDAVTGADGANFGAVVGALTGVLVGLGALAIPGIGPVLAAGPLLAALGGGAIGAVAGAATGGIVGSLVISGIPEEEAKYYAEGVRRGGTLLSVNASSDGMAEQAVAILNRHGAVNVNERVEDWRRSGWTGYDPNAKPYTTQEMNKFRSPMTVTQPVAVKKATSTGNEGRAVPPLTQESAQVGSSKYVRSTESLPEPYATDFMTHYRTYYASTGNAYDRYVPAYRYGYNLASDKTYIGDWNTIEGKARAGWEARSQGTWEDFKDAIRYAWDKVRGVDTARTSY